MAKLDKQVPCDKCPAELQKQCKQADIDVEGWPDCPKESNVELQVCFDGEHRVVWEEDLDFITLSKPELLQLLAMFKDTR